MRVKAGLKLRSTACSTQIIVVRAAAGPVELTCCGAPMTDDLSGEAAAAPDPGADGVLLGKRYTDADSGIEVLCTKPGAGELAVDGRPLVIKGAAPLPSSD